MVTAMRKTVPIVAAVAALCVVSVPAQEEAELPGKSEAAIHSELVALEHELSRLRMNNLGELKRIANMLQGEPIATNRGATELAAFIDVEVHSLGATLNNSLRLLEWFRESEGLSAEAAENLKRRVRHGCALQIAATTSRLNGAYALLLPEELTGPAEDVRARIGLRLAMMQIVAEALVADEKLAEARAANRTGNAEQKKRNDEPAGAGRR